MNINAKTSETSEMLNPVDFWISQETQFTDNMGHGAALQDLIIIEGRGVHKNIVITAGHAVKCVRNGGHHKSEIGTGSLAITLAKLLGCGAIICARYTNTDPNYDLEHPLKDATLDLKPTAVIDLHGMRDRPGSELDIGTAQNLVPAGFVESLTTNMSVVVTVNKYFNAGPKGTVTCWMQRHKIPACQLEITGSLRPQPKSTHLEQETRQNMERALASIVIGIQKIGGGLNR